MASRRFDPLKILGIQRVAVEGRFFPNGSGTIDNTANLGLGWTVARSGVGTYVVTFADIYFALDSIRAGVQLATPSASLICAGTWTPSARTLVLQNFTDGSAADIAANANNSVSFFCVFRNSSVLY